MPVPPSYVVTATDYYTGSFEFFQSTNGYGFLPGWFGSPAYYDSTSTDYINFVSFQRIGDIYKIELADTEVAWVLASTDGADNVSTDITWAASASLAVPAAIVLAAFATL